MSEDNQDCKQENAQPFPSDTTLTISGWPLVLRTDDAEPRIRDTDLCDRLGMTAVTTVRQLIDRHIHAGNLKDTVVLSTVLKTSGGRPGKRYLLCEADALFVTAKSETPKAVALLHEIINVYILARRQMLPGQDSGTLASVREDIQGLRTAQVEIGLMLEMIRRNIADSQHREQQAQLVQAQMVCTLAEVTRSMQSLRTDVQSAERQAYAANQASIGKYEARTSILGALNDITAVRLRFDHRSKRSVRKWLEIRLRNALGLPQGIAFDMLLKSKMPEVQLSLKEMLADATERAELHAGKKPEPVQQELFYGDTPPPPPDGVRTPRSTKLN